MLAQTASRCSLLTACRRRPRAAPPSACQRCFAPLGRGLPLAAPGWRGWRCAAGEWRRGWAGWGRPAAPPPSCRSSSRECRTALHPPPAEQRVGRGWSCCMPFSAKGAAAAAAAYQLFCWGACRLACDLRMRWGCAGGQQVAEGPSAGLSGRGLLACVRCRLLRAPDRLAIVLRRA